MKLAHSEELAPRQRDLSLPSIAKTVSSLSSSVLGRGREVLEAPETRQGPSCRYEAVYYLSFLINYYRLQLNK